MTAVPTRVDQYFEGGLDAIVGLSRSAQRLLVRPRPRFRGLLHRWAAAASLGAGLAVVVFADGPRATIAMVLQGVGMTFMFGVSALVHCRDWAPSQVETLVRLDHSAIFVMFATSGTPIAWLGLDPPVSGWLLLVLWAGATVGVAAEWAPRHPPRGVMNAAYLGFGWGTIAFLPWMIRDLDAVSLGLLFGGGMAYTLGAIVVGSRRPDPWPHTFGYHEIWHVAVVLAAALHLALGARLAGVL